MAYLVGGALRDLFRDTEPRDFDVATNASLDEIRKLFRNSKTIGKRFPIVHTYFGPELIEISSLKGEKELSKEALLLADAKLRDFTVNAMFYDIDSFEVLDPLGALDDVLEGRVVSIGDPDQVFVEDPVRMLRAVKLHVKHGFDLTQEVAAAIGAHRKQWAEMGAGRKYEELTRVILSPYRRPLLEACRRLELMPHMWPAGHCLLEAQGVDFFDRVARHTPIHYSRGSYGKFSHIYLWLALAVASEFFVADRRLAEIKDDFDRFIAPLGMPFRAPVVEALHFIVMMRHGKDPTKEKHRIARETERLLDHYVADAEPRLAPRLTQLLKSMHSHPRERRPHGHEKAEGGRNARRRGRRGGRRRRRGKTPNA